MKQNYKLKCNIAQALNLIGEKWALLIIHQLDNGPKTYSELQEALEDIPTNLLSKRLQDLVGFGLIDKTVYQTTPKRYSYQLTPKADGLDDVINALIIWGDKALDTSYKCLEAKSHPGKVSIAYKCELTGDEVTKADLIIRDVQ